MKYHILSDLEGYDINNYTKDINPQNIQKETVYVCGDILDSTAVFPLNIDNKDKTNILQKKIFNLQNIYKFITQTNDSNIIYKLILGNRDLNKIKCKFLCELDTDINLIKNIHKTVKKGSIILNTSFSAQLIKLYNNGEVNLNYETYTSYKVQLTTSENPWKIKSMNEWYPFWNISKNKKNWSVIENNSKTPFLTRFNEIFGSDPNTGTMSAENLLHCIPFEIGSRIDKKEATKLYTEDKKGENDTDDYKAFIVLAIFKSMLCEYSESKMEPITDFTKISNSNMVKGWLTKLYTDSDVVTDIPSDVVTDIPSDVVTDIPNNVYILSHGGLTYKLLNSKE